MDAMTQMAAALAAVPQTKQELRAAKNRRHYLRVREAHQWRWKLKRLSALCAVIKGEANANR